MSNNSKYDTWQKQLIEAVKTYRAEKWQVADLLLEGMDRFGEAMFWSATLEKTYLSRHTIEKWLRISKTFKPSDRNDELSFTHHELLMALPTKENRLAVLAVAAAAEWSTEELRLRTAAFRRKEKTPFDPSWKPDSAPLRLVDPAGDGVNSISPLTRTETVSHETTAATEQSSNISEIVPSPIQAALSASAQLWETVTTIEALASQGANQELMIELSKAQLGTVRIIKAAASLRIIGHSLANHEGRHGVTAAK